MRNHTARDMVVLSCWAAMLFFAGNGLSATHSVEKDGSGEFTEIQAAVDVSAPGDTILIGPGEYDQAHTIYVPSWSGNTEVFVEVDVENLTFIGTSLDEVVVGPPYYYQTNFGTVFFGIGPSGTGLVGAWRIENVTIRNFWTGILATGEFVADSCRLKGHVGGAIAGFDAGGSTYVNCEFLNNGDGINERRRDYVHISDCYFEYSGNYFDSVADLLIENCTGVRGGGSTHGGTVGLIKNVQLTNSGFGFMGGSNIVVRNSSFDSPASDAISATEASQVLLDSCIVSAVGWAIFAGENAQLTVNNSHILSETGPAVMCARYPGPDYILDLTGNYWGTADPEEIPALIFDGNDDPSVHAFVKYTPIAAGPVSVEKSSWGDLKAMFR